MGKKERKQIFPYSYMIFIKLIRIVEKHKELEPIYWKKKKVYKTESNDKLTPMSTKQSD